MPNVNISGRDATELYTGVLDNVLKAHVRISYSFGDTEANVDWGSFYPPAAYSSLLVTKVTLVISNCRVSELLYAKNHFFRTPPTFGRKCRGSPWSRPVMLRSAESEHPRLTNREIILEEFQPMSSQSINVTDRRTLDRRHAIARPRLAL